MTHRSTRPARTPIARIQLGRAAETAVTVYGETAAELGAPLVELGAALEHLQHLTPAQADALAAALTLAARQARGEAMPPTELDHLLESRKNSRNEPPELLIPLKHKRVLPPD